MVVIVTGAGGIVGSRFISHLLSDGCEVFAYGGGSIEVDKDLPYFYLGDRMSVDNLPQRDKDIDAIYHLGWSGSNGPKRLDPEIQNKNIGETVNIIKLMQLLNCKKFIGVGTISEIETLSCLMGSPERNANFLYGLAKITACEEARIICSNSSMHFNWVRLGNTYHETDDSPKFLNMVCDKLSTGNDLVTSFGTQYYDFINLDDAVHALAMIGRKSVHGKTYYVGSGEARQLRDFVNIVKKVFNSSSKIIFDPNNVVQGIPFDSFSIDDLKNDCGFSPTISFVDGCKKMAIARGVKL